jgi:hypothetical protein
MYQIAPGEPLCTFVIRMWMEWSGEGPFWRGSIEHLQSGNRAAFQRLADIHDFINKNVEKTFRNEIDPSESDH